MLTIDEEQENESLGLVTCIREHNLCFPRLCILACVRRDGVRTAVHLQQRLSNVGAVQEVDCLRNGRRGG